ncbi:MAG: ParB/RepB/Spo0J family partition protein [Clostridia bacterium]|nr:ParB/RepB/Spo0J family partition protein [Clostridia bacterium]
MKRGLGKGLDALFADNSEEAGNGSVTVRLTEIEPNRAQPRKKFDEDALEQLSESIRNHGILQPLVVRPVPGAGGYQLVAGERRWRAARMAGLTEVPVVIRELSDNEAMEVALIENLQREDLNPVEEAEGYRMLLESYSMTQEEIAERVGRSRPAVANALRLLGLPKDVLEMVRSGSLSQGHARTLLGIENGDQLKKTAEEVSEKGLSVREVEKLVRQAAQPEKVKPPSPQKTMLEGEIERGLSEQLGRKVKITRGKNRGVLEIEFYNEEDLKQLSMLLSGD